MKMRYFQIETLMSRSNQKWILLLVDVEFKERKIHSPKRGWVKKDKNEDNNEDENEAMTPQRKLTH